MWERFCATVCRLGVGIVGTVGTDDATGAGASRRWTVDDGRLAVRETRRAHLLVLFGFGLAFGFWLLVFV